MKLLKIGRSSQCNLVLQSQKVSALHAEMTLLDNGEILLVDKGSTNGTFVGGNRIDPETEVKVRRGDKIVFADMTLSWNQVPDLKKENEKYAAVYNIGKSYNNDIRLTSDFGSRYHAQIRVTKNKKAFLIDMQSKNGTKVNGVALQPNKEIQIKRGDNVICADEDISDQVKQLLPPPFPILKIGIAVACVAALVGLFFVVKPLLHPTQNNPLAEAIKTEGATVLRPATVYVRAHFHYVVKIEDCPVSSDVWDGEMTLDALGENFMVGTAFFVDREGRMVTNRHITKPWDEDYYSLIDKDIDKDLKSWIYKFKEKVTMCTIAYANGNASAIIENGLGEYLKYADVLIKEAVKNSRRKGTNDAIGELNEYLDRLVKSDITIDGKMDYITVGYPGRFYTHADEYERCNVLGESKTDDIDVGILQLNTKKTPDDIKYIYDINYIREKDLQPQKDVLYTIGYPMGELRNLDEKSKSLEPEVRDTKCSKVPSRYTFDFQESSVGGASGSPVFDEEGRLCGVLCGGYSNGPTKAVQAKYIKDIYDEFK